MKMPRMHRRCRCSWWLRVFHLLSLPLLLLVGCSSPPNPPPSLLPLHLPGVVQLNAVADLEAETGNHVIDSILAYRPTGDETTTHLLLLGHGQLYDIRLDGSGLRSIQMEPSCYFLGAIDPQSKHGLCWAEPGVQAFDLDATALSWRPRLLVPTSSASAEALMSPTIAPDGQHFAAMHRVGSGYGTAINIYAVDRSMTNASLVATIPLPGLHARRLLWSPDGKWLAFTTDETTYLSTIGATYAFPIAAILPTLPAQGSRAIQAVLRKAQLTKLVDGTNETNVWRPSGAIWTYVDGHTIWQLDLVTRKRTAILSISDGAICALTWTPDGKQLVFVQCRPAGIAQPPPARLYVYTLPAT